MPAITLWQPWATWIAWGWKTIETRIHARFACLEGRRIAIHAGKRFDGKAIDAARPILWVRNGWRLDMEVWKRRETYPYGRILCTAHVDEARWLKATDSARALCDCSAGDLFGLVLSGANLLSDPVRARGSQGIWYLTEAQERALCPVFREKGDTPAPIVRRGMDIQRTLFGPAADGDRTEIGPHYTTPQTELSGEDHAG